MTDEIRYDRFRGPPSTRGGAVPLPVRDPEATFYRAVLATAEAVFTIDNAAGEVRVPYVVGFQAGDFQRLLDALVSDLERRRIRFVNLPPKGAMAELHAEAGLERRRDIRDAVHGFELVEEEWTYRDERGPCECLVGEWESGTATRGDDATAG